MPFLDKFENEQYASFMYEDADPSFRTCHFSYGVVSEVMMQFRIEKLHRDFLTTQYFSNDHIDCGEQFTNMYLEFLWLVLREMFEEALTHCL